MSDAPILKVEELHCHFPTRNDWGFKNGEVRALDGVSIDLARGEILGIVGESGCGKSTLGKTIAGINPMTAGTIEFEGEEIASAAKVKRSGARRMLQYCYQDPAASLDPRWKIGSCLTEPLIVHMSLSRHQRRERSIEALSAVGLPERYMDLYPHEISGGQQRRVGLARILMLHPSCVILDEPTSGLDVSVQAIVLNLLLQLKEQFKLSYIFISHDLSVVRLLSNRICVMYLGRIVEIGLTSEIMSAPKHPYTQSLLAAVPEIGGRRVTETFSLEGEPPSPGQLPPGCRFAGRCPRVQAKCLVEDPALRWVDGSRQAACHFA